jgi:hypothetical protein
MTVYQPVNEKLLAALKLDIYGEPHQSSSTHPARLSKLKEWMALVSYKPGWDIRVEDNHYGESVLQVIFRTEDTFHPGREVQVASQDYVPYYVNSFDLFTEYLEKMLFKVEQHECQEWLKLRETGRPINNPHAHDY